MSSEYISQPATAESTNLDALFPIVGIAASAGGLEAFTQLLKHLPIDTGMAFVLIQHLDPNHKSLLTEILARTTQMPVSEVQDGVAVEPNQVYVIPPNTKMTLSQGMLQLTPREKIYGKYMPGDTFFASLAAAHGHKAIAVVLSGADGDGSLGLKAIKVAGGVTFAQCEATAKFESMPNTAVATGYVDFILPPQEIAEELTRLSRYSFDFHPLSVNTVEEASASEDALSTIFALLRSSTGVDFSHYKRTTLDRRIQRRMLLYKLERLEDYAQYLQDNLAEVKALYEEILIHVTSFFRDPEAFQLLKERVFPTITQNKPAESPIRIWVTGCSTGEEVYSLVICLLEFLKDKATQPPIQIFATDISETAIDKARSGIYQENQMVDVSPERRRRFFNFLERGGYQISKAVRELCVFARQDLGSDPPFSNLDLISCRNVLIYLGEALQKRVMPIFHYSLNPAGFLLLGTSESTGKFSDLFTLVDKKYKIYAKKLTVTRPTFSFVTSNHLTSANLDDRKPMKQNSPDGFDLQKETDQLLLEHYAPVGVVINDKMDVLQLRGKIDLYLRLTPGAASFNLFKMARDGLLVELRAAIYQTQRQEIPVRKEGLRIEKSDRSRIVNLEVIPFKAPIAEERRFLVLFEEASPTISNLSTINPKSVEPGDLEREVVWLRQELAAANQERAATHEYLQTVSQEQENINQDLKVANEEILSSNEELQSTNEELETAKEEIQATNEELNITNEELRSRNFELHQVNNDLTNFLASINIPILMLSNDLLIRRFTPMAQKLFNFISADAGRPLSDIRANLNIPDLEPLILEVLDTLNVKELEVQTQAGHWYNLRIRPYRTTENQIDGVVLVLVDIDALKRSTEQIKESRDYAEAIVGTIPEPLVVLDANLRVNTANPAFYKTFQVSRTQTENNSIFELGNGQWDIPQLRSLLEEVFPKNNQINNFEVEHVFEEIGRRTMLLNACKILRIDNQEMILLFIQDITSRKLFEAQRNQLLTQEQSARTAAEAANRTKDEFLSIVSHELRNPLTSILGWTQLLRGRKFDAAKTEHALEIVERSARAQVKLIEDILEISRVTTGKLQLNVSVIALAPVIESAIDVARLSAEAKNIQIEAVLEPETIQVSGDPDRLQQVIWNLLSNAIKFTPVRGRVAIKLEHTGSLAQIQVSDTGQGISTDFLPYVFERFRQEDGSKTRATSGLGLGLSIVRHLVELHGGTVHAASPGEGQGTTMTVRLPLQVLPTNNFQPSNLDQVDSTVGRVVPSDSIELLEGLRVLVVDDEAGMLELLTTILEQYGVQVTAVDSAKEAIAVLSANPGQHDVLLSDIGMPNEDGYTLIRRVRALSADLGGQIPAAALTAYVRVEEQREAIAAGFQRHIIKPVEPAQLVSIVANLAALSRT